MKISLYISLISKTKWSRSPHTFPLLSAEGSMRRSLLGRWQSWQPQDPPVPLSLGEGRGLCSWPSSTFVLARLPRLIHLEVTKMGAETMV